MKRKIIKIDEEKCNGCGLCIPDCPEGALQIIDGKARLVSDLFCDGLGACIGNCPEGAISVEERTAEPYDERKVMENVIQQGEGVIKAHLKHLLDHGEKEYFKQAVEALRKKGMSVPDMEAPCMCPGTKSEAIQPKSESSAPLADEMPAQLTHWPVQLHLISPMASCFKGADVIITADCVGYAYGNFHQRFMKEKAIVIACPKLDSEKERYTEKIKSLVEDAESNTLNVIIMEVPCCMGLLSLAQKALSGASRKVPLKLTVIGVKGDIVSERWL